ncbi:hypothetical protein G3O06_29665 [Burkholderia sp. Ac-20345]|nr:hypothetical protein [Burkholderia sp. Ac-20345]
MKALYDVGQQKTVARGAGLSLTNTFRLLTICVPTAAGELRGVDWAAC